MWHKGKDHAEIMTAMFNHNRGLQGRASTSRYIVVFTRHRLPKPQSACEIGDFCVGISFTDGNQHARTVDFCGTVLFPRWKL